jgi:type IV secretion system protein VirD4
MDGARLKLTRRLYIFADEFGIFPYMGNILGMFGASRSRNIIIVPCIQSPAQLRQTYGADGETIIRDCCQTVIFGGFSPMSDTAVTFSKLLGNQTVAAGSVSTNNREGRSLFGSGSNSSRSVNMIARPLMTPDELQLLPFGKWVVNRRGSHPFIANMPRYDKWGIRLEAPYISETREYVPTAYAKLDDVIRTIKEEKWRQTVREKRESANSSESVGSTADY